MNLDTPLRRTSLPTLKHINLVPHLVNLVPHLLNLVPHLLNLVPHLLNLVPHLVNLLQEMRYMSFRCTPTGMF